MDEIKRINGELDLISRMVEVLCPNQTEFDRKYLEEKDPIELISIFSAYDFNNYNIFVSLETLHFMGFDVAPLIQRIGITLSRLLDTWLRSYNRNSLRKAKDELYLYESDTLKSYIYKADSKLTGFLYEVNNFAKLYFPTKSNPSLYSELNFDDYPENLLVITIMRNEEALPTIKNNSNQYILKNNFDDVDSKDVINHFRVLVERKYLSEQELNAFLKAAFELNIPPKQSFKIKDAPSKIKIESIFYKYYKNIAGKPHGKQRKYAALLGDYFQGFKTDTVSSNFSKSVL